MSLPWLGSFLLHTREDSVTVCLLIEWLVSLKTKWNTLYLWYSLFFWNGDGDSMAHLIPYQNQNQKIQSGMFQN